MVKVECRLTVVAEIELALMSRYVSGVFCLFGSVKMRHDRRSSQTDRH